MTAPKLEPIVVSSLRNSVLDKDEPESDEPLLESTLHLFQIMVLLQCLQWLWRDRQDYFVAGNLSIFYEPAQIQGKAHRFIGPDFFVVLNCNPRPRKSWVVWKEGGRFPNMIVELLSSSTAKTDRGAKKALYQDRFQTPEYFWFDPDSLEFAGWQLVEGVYTPIPRTPEGWCWSKELELYLGTHQKQLRFFTPDRGLVPLPEESAEQAERDRQVAEQQARSAQQQAKAAQQQARSAQQQAKAERQQRQQAEQQAQALREQLRRLGIEPEI